MATFGDVQQLNFTIPLTPEEWTRPERAVLVFGTVSFLFNLLVLVWLNVAERIWNLHFIKIIQMPLLTCTFIVEGFFWLGTLNSVRIIPQTGVFLICDLWSFWMYLPLGGTASITLLFHRFWKFYQIILRGKPASGWRFYSVPVLLWLPSLLCGIALSATTGAGPIEASGYEICSIPTVFQGIELAHVALLILIVLVMVIRLWRTNVYEKYAHEFKAACVCFVIYALVVIGYGIILAFRFQYTHDGRVLCAFIVMLTTNTYLWAFIYRAVFNSIFRREQADKESRERMHSDNMSFSNSPRQTNSSSGDMRRSQSIELIGP